MEPVRSLPTDATCSHQLEDLDLIHITHDNEREVVAITQSRGCGKNLWVGHRVDMLRAQADQLVARVESDANWAVFHSKERIWACNLAQVRCLLKSQSEDGAKITLYLADHDTTVAFSNGSDEPACLIEKYRTVMTKVDSRIQEQKNALFEIENGDLIIGLPLCSAITTDQKHVFLYSRSKIGNGHTIPCENSKELMSKLSATWQRRENITISEQPIPVAYINSRFPDREFKVALN